MIENRLVIPAFTLTIVADYRGLHNFNAALFLITLHQLYATKCLFFKVRVGLCVTRWRWPMLLRAKLVHRLTAINSVIYVAATLRRASETLRKMKNIS
jgi:hypothetical protein